MVVYQDVTDQSDDRTQAYTSSPACQFLKQRQKNVNMNRQEWIKIGKRLFSQHLIVYATFLQGEMYAVLEYTLIVREELLEV